MAQHRPLIVDQGQVKQLPVGDTVVGATASSSGAGNLDGGSAVSNFGGTIGLDGGTSTSTYPPQG